LNGQGISVENIMMFRKWYVGFSLMWMHGYQTEELSLRIVGEALTLADKVVLVLDKSTNVHELNFKQWLTCCNKNKCKSSDTCLKQLGSHCCIEQQEKYKWATCMYHCMSAVGMSAVGMSVVGMSAVGSAVGMVSSG